MEGVSRERKGLSPTTGESKGWEERVEAQDLSGLDQVKSLEIT